MCFLCLLCVQGQTWLPRNFQLVLGEDYQYLSDPDSGMVAGLGCWSSQQVQGTGGCGPNVERGHPPMSEGGW